MAITGQISLARPGRNVQIFQDVSDINDIFDSNSTPVLQQEDHITLYPGDFTNIDPIVIPENVYVTVLPGARLNYKFELGELEKASRISERYEDISGNVENVADLHIANQYQTTKEQTSSRIRVYANSIEDSKSPFVEYNSLDKAAREVQENETVLVFPGEYRVTRNLMIDNVEWNFLAGSTVVFDPDWILDFDNDNIAPFSLFDDSVDVNGVSESNSKNTKVYGRGEFIVGSKNPAPVTTAELIDEPILGEGVWKYWHKYGLISLSQNGSKLSFEAKNIRIRENLDSAIKYSDSESLKVNAEKVLFEDSHGLGENILNVLNNEDKEVTFKNTNLIEEQPPLPTFFLANSSETDSDAAEINIQVKNVEVKEKTTEDGDFPYLAVGANLNDRISFDDNLYLSFGEYEGPSIRESIFFTQSSSPNKIVVYDSILKNAFVIAGSPNNFGNENTEPTPEEVPDPPPKTSVIVKNTEIKTDQEPPIIIGGSAQGTDLSLSDVWLLNGDEGLTLQDRTPETKFNENAEGDNEDDKTFDNIFSDFIVKVYGESFTNYPLESYELILDDELNNIAWSEEVTSIR